MYFGCIFAMMKTTITPGARYIKDEQVLHVKAVRANNVLTTRGIKSFEEMAEWTLQPLKSRKANGVTAVLKLEEKQEMYKHFKTTAEAIRFAIAHVKLQTATPDKIYTDRLRLLSALEVVFEMFPQMHYLGMILKEIKSED